MFTSVLSIDKYERKNTHEERVTTGEVVAYYLCLNGYSTEVRSEYYARRRKDRQHEV